MLQFKKWISGITAGVVLLSGMAFSGVEGALTEVVSGMPEMTASAEEISVPVGTGTTTLTYDYLSSGTIEITGCDITTEGELEIPAEIDGVAVTVIRDYAFSGCESLTSITIPSGVETIGQDAFCNCSSLSAIVVDPENAYYSSIDGVLYDKAQETLLLYPVGRSDESYEFPDSVTAIGDYVFCNCDSLTTVVINDHIEKIGRGAFCGCDSLTSVTIGNSVTSIGSCAFYGCTSLTSITILDSVTSIESYAFYNCDSLTCITIPDGVTSIGDDAFGSCNSLTSVTIPDSVTSIGSSAFQNCNSLTSITIGNGVTSIGSSAFSIGLKEIYYNGTEEEWDNLLGDHPLSYYFYAPSSDYTGDVVVHFCDAHSRIESISVVFVRSATETTSLALSSQDSWTGLNSIADTQSDASVATTTTPDEATTTTTQTTSTTTSTTTAKSTTSTTADVSAQVTTKLTTAYFDEAPGETVRPTSTAESEDTTTTTTTTTATSQTTTVAKTADLDGDDAITISDAFFCLTAYANSAAGNDDGLTEAQREAADVDGDGNITIMDASYILQFYAQTAAGNSPTWTEILSA